MTAEHAGHPSHVRAGRSRTPARACGRDEDGARAGGVHRRRHRLDVRAGVRSTSGSAVSSPGSICARPSERDSGWQSSQTSRSCAGSATSSMTRRIPTGSSGARCSRVLRSWRSVQLILELPCVYPRHLGDVPELAASFPDMTIVIDHLGKPPLRSAEMRSWETDLRSAASHRNVAAKISGLDTRPPRGRSGRGGSARGGRGGSRRVRAGAPPVRKRLAGGSAQRQL